MAFVLLALALLSALGIVAQTKELSPRFTLTISAEKPVVALGSDVWIKVQQTNVSQHGVGCDAVVVDSTVDYSYKYDVRDEHGRPAPKVVRRPGLSADDYPCGLGPGESRTSLNEISQVFQFNQPGEYTVQISRLATDDPKDGFIKSNTITITVLPEEEAPPADNTPAEQK
jgi:hypothetical protein